MFNQQNRPSFGFGAASSNNNAFGSSTPASTGFGGAASGSTFGTFGQQTQNKPLFGSTPAATSNPFSTPAATGTGAGLFGGATSGGSLFGQQQTSSFLKPSTSSAFGTSGGFGTSGAVSTGGLFGTSQPTSSSLFSHPTSSATVGTSGGLFGASQPATSSGFSLFGAPTVASTGTTGVKFTPLEGQDTMVKNGVTQNVKTKHYCITAMKAYEGKSLEELRLEDYAAGIKGPQKPAAVAATGGGLFGGASGFGAAASKPGGLFSTQPASSASANIFGSTSSAAGSGFGGFGQTTTTTASMFGNKPAGTGLFGAPAPSQPLFPQTSTTTNAFGSQPAAAAGAGLFGAAKPLGFGATSAANTGFGFNTQGNTSNTGSLFGKPTASVFGQQPAAATGNTGFGFGQANAVKPAFPTFPAAGTGFGAAAQTAQPAPVSLTSAADSLQAQQQQVQQQIVQLSNSPYGDSSLFRTTSKDSAIKPTDPATQKAVLASSSGTKNKLTSGPVAKVKLSSLRSVQAIGSGHKSLNPASDLLLDDGISESSHMRKSVKKLVIRSPAQQQTFSLNSTSLNNSMRVLPHSPAATSLHADANEETFRLQTNNVQQMTSPQRHAGVDIPLDDTIAQLNGGELEVDSKDRSIIPPCKALLTKSDYYTIPVLDECVPDENGHCFVEGFIIGRVGYGSVYFPGQTDIAELDLDSTVHFRHKEITVYPNDDDRPKEGEGLNKKAEVTLDCVWPNDKENHSPIKSPNRLTAMNYRKKIEIATAKLGAKFIDYRPDTGSWVFEVKHFSKYGLLDDSDDEEVLPEAGDVKKLHTLQDQMLNVQKQAVVNVKLEQRAVPPLSEISLAATKSAPAAPLDVTFPAGKGQMSHQAASLDSVRKPFFTQMSHEDDDMTFTSVQDIKENMPPVSHQLAALCVVQPSSMQRLKASFLEDDDDVMEQTAALTDSPLTGKFKLIGKHFDHSDLLSPLMKYSPAPTEVKSQITEPTKRLTSEFTLPEPEYLKLPSGGRELRRDTHRLQRLYLTEVPLSEASGCASCLLDSACLNSRRCRVGWSADGVIVAPGSALQAGGSQSILEPAACHSHKRPVTITSVSCRTRDEAYREKALRVQLRHSIMRTDQDDTLPRFEASPGIAALHEYGQESLNNLDNVNLEDKADEMMHDALVWELAVALWGTLPEFEHAQELDFDSYMYKKARREAFSRWLTYAASQQSEKLDSTVSDYLKEIFDALTARQIHKACQIASKNGDHRLALLISQSNSAPSFAHMLHKQLCDWLHSGADKFISEDRMRIYALLAGCFVWESTDRVINCCADVDWKRALALHFWYGTSSISQMSIPAAMAMYDAAWTDSRYAASPVRNENMGEDACYHLIKLFCERSYPLHKLLTPNSFSDDSLDYHMSWHLMQVLQSLNYVHLTDWQRTSIHSRYAEQLIESGAWQWAVFIYLHMTDDKLREDSVLDVLIRHVRLEEEQDEDYEACEHFLCTELCLPEAWLHRAKAIRARSIGSADSEAWHLLNSWQFDRASDLLFSAPECLAAYWVVGGETNKLEKFLDLLTLGRHSLPDWDITANIYILYTELINTVNSQQKVSKDSAEFDSLQSKVCALSSSLPNVHCTSNIQQLCKTIIARRLIQGFRLLNEHTTPNTTTAKQREFLKLTRDQDLPSDEAMLLLRECMAAFLSQY